MSLHLPKVGERFEGNTVTDVVRRGKMVLVYGVAGDLPPQEIARLKAGPQKPGEFFFRPGKRIAQFKLL